MPSKQQKKADKAEQRLQDKQKQDQLLKDEQSWENGSNKRGALRKQQLNDKHEEKMKNAKEKRELLAEEETIGSGKKSKTRKMKGDDFDLLNQSLASMPKTKVQKEKEEKMRQKEEQRKLEQQKQIEKEEFLEKQRQEEKELKYKNIVDNSNIMMNKLDNDENHVNTIDDAIDLLNDDGDSTMAFKEFYRIQYLLLKEENPNLRLNQYKERIYKLWKKSPDNPCNKMI